jgi:hypothetical protein
MTKEIVVCTFVLLLLSLETLQAQESSTLQTERMKQRMEQRMEQGVEGMEQRTDESREERVEDVLVKLGEEVTLDCEASQRYAETILVHVHWYSAFTVKYLWKKNLSKYRKLCQNHIKNNCPQPDST